MARKKHKPKSAAKHNDPREAFHLPVQLQLALECDAALANLPTTKSAVIRVCLDEAMRAKGRLPLKDEQLRELVAAVGFDNLSPHAQDYLRKAGIAGE